MNKEDVGDYYVDDNGDVYLLIMFCEEPTFTMEKVKDGTRVGGGVSSLIARGFTKLVPEKEREG